MKILLLLHFAFFLFLTTLQIRIHRNKRLKKLLPELSLKPEETKWANLLIGIHKTAYKD